MISFYLQNEGDGIPVYYIEKACGTHVNEKRQNIFWFENS
jgi:hypothetical protein